MPPRVHLPPGDLTAAPRCRDLLAAKLAEHDTALDALDAGSAGGVSVTHEGAPIAGSPFNELTFIGPTVTVADAGGGEVDITIEGDHALASVIDNKGPVFGAQRGFTAVAFDGTFIVLTLDVPIADITKAIVLATIQDDVSVATLSYTIAGSCVVGTDVYVRVWDLVGAGNVFRPIFVRVVVLP